MLWVRDGGKTAKSSPSIGSPWGRRRGREVRAVWSLYNQGLELTSKDAEGSEVVVWDHILGTVGFIRRLDQEDGKNCKENSGRRVPETVGSQRGALRLRSQARGKEGPVGQV